MRPDQIIVALAVGPQAYYVCSVLSWGREKKKREREREREMAVTGVVPRVYSLVGV